MPTQVLIAEFMHDAAVAALRQRFATTYDPDLGRRRDALLGAVESVEQVTAALDAGAIPGHWPGAASITNVSKPWSRR